jgi:hypothetical protein
MAVAREDLNDKVINKIKSCIGLLSGRLRIEGRIKYIDTFILIEGHETALNGF